MKQNGNSRNFERIWLFSADKIKSPESFSKQPTQLILELNSSLRHIIVKYGDMILSYFHQILLKKYSWIGEKNWWIDVTKNIFDLPVGQSSEQFH